VTTLYDWLITALQLGGLGQLLLVAASPMIPRVLKWREDTAKLPPLTRQVFWTYAYYIVATNFWFGLVCLFLAGELLGPTILSASVTALITLYWGARIGIQFFYYDRKSAPPGFFARYGEV